MPGKAKGSSSLARLVMGLVWLLLAESIAGAAEPRFVLPPGYEANLYASGLGRARLMQMTDTGDIILSVPPDRVLLIKADRDGDGRSDGTAVLAAGLASPHGLLLEGNQLLVATESRVVRFGFDSAAGRLTGAPEVLLDGVPDDGGHSTRTLKRGPDGALYLSIGSSCNVCSERDPWRAAMLRFLPGERPEIFASGLRNTVGFDWQPGTGDLYGVDNGRDSLGDDFPPCELNLIRKGGFYGWPFWNGDNVPDPDLGGSSGSVGLQPIAPAHPFGAHVAPLSIRFLRHLKAPGQEGAALVAQHGSWDRSERSGYQIASLHFAEGGKITERPFMTGFITDGDVISRPVDILEARDGTLYVSDDYAGAIWRVRYTAP